MSVFELGYRYLLPSINRRLVEKLCELGLMKIEIARKLKLSHSAISRYLAMQRGYFIDLTRFPDVEEMIAKLALTIKEKNLSIYDIQREILKIALYVLSRKYLCEYHAKISLDIELDKCNICPTIFHIS